MKYQIVEKDIEEEIGYLHPVVYSSKLKAKKYIKILRKTLSEKYYDLFLVEANNE